MKKWTNKFPTPKKIKTKWWFYGWAFGKLYPDTLEEEPPELVIIECIRITDGYTYISNGNFFYKSEATGVFREFESIETPTVDELKSMIK